MKLWKDMSDEEKGALLLAYHEGKTIEYRNVDWNLWYKARKGETPSLGWHDDYYYRLEHVPVVTELAIYSSGMSFGVAIEAMRGHKITFNLVDGEPDCNSIKMIKIKE